jgi:ATP-dependent Lon protease
MPKRKNNDQPIVKKTLTTVYRSLIDHSNTTEIDYFETMSFEEQSRIIDELKLLKLITEIDTPYRIQLLHKTASIKFKVIALKKINVLEKMDPEDGEYNKLKKWVEAFLLLPFESSKTIPISIKDGFIQCQEYMEKCKQILNDTTYGLNDAKMQIMQIVGQWLSNPGSVGNAIGLKGPMGTGKTTLIKHGLSRMLERDFAFVTLGGQSDGSFLTGHSYTYEGSHYGKIADILIQCGSNNPIIFFDELDKISETYHGDEIVGILTHMIDSTQNTEFHDKYFSEIDINLSKCLFVFSFNDEDKINKILKDRMHVIETKGYQSKDKLIICKQFLIPAIEKEMNMKDCLLFTDDIIKYIIERGKEEQGVRNLKRTIEIVFSKLNVYRFFQPNTMLFDNKIIDVQFPYTVNKEFLDEILPKVEENVSHLNMYL